MENKTRVFTTFQQSIGIFQEKPKLANGEYENCGRQLARMISTQLCDKQLFLGLDTFETFWENHQLMFMDCIHTKMFDVFSPRTIQSQLKSQLNNWPRVLYFRKYFLIALR